MYEDSLLRDEMLRLHKVSGLAGADEECGIVKGILLGTCMGLSCSEEEASPDE